MSSKVQYNKLVKGMKKRGWQKLRTKGSHEVWMFGPTGIQMVLPRKRRTELVGEPFLRQIKQAEAGWLQSRPRQTPSHAVPNPPAVGSPIPRPWVLASPTPPVSYPTHGNYYEVYVPGTGSGVQTVLVLHEGFPPLTEAQIQGGLADENFHWVAAVYDPGIGRWYEIIEKGSTEDLQFFRRRMDALYRAEFVERDIRSARVSRLPDFAREDLTAYLDWFEKQVPNRVDYLRLLWSNDPNGAYDAILSEPVSYAEEVFREVFEEDLRKRNKAANIRAANPVAALEERLAALEAGVARYAEAARRNPGSDPLLEEMIASCRCECEALRAEISVLGS